MVEVLQNFIDKNNKSVMFKVGQKLDWTDEDRIADCVKRGLVKVIEEEKPKKTIKKVTKKKTTKK